MAHLAALKIVNKTALSTLSAEERKRDKLIMKLQEQLAMAEAAIKGTIYARHKWVTRADEDGEPERVQRPVRLKQWWYKDRTGDVLFTVRYGSKTLELAKGMAAIDVGTIDKLPAVINTLIKAVHAGELDVQLAAVINERQFLPKKPKTKHLNRTFT